MDLFHDCAVPTIDSMKELFKLDASNHETRWPVNQSNAETNWLVVKKCLTSWLLGWCPRWNLPACHRTRFPLL